MFGKSDLVDSLNRDLARARDKRDALASGVAMLTAQIAELEARLSAENDRRERERAANEIEGVKKQVRDVTSNSRPLLPGFATRPKRRWQLLPRRANLMNY
jgi:phage shock protein A